MIKVEIVESEIKSMLYFKHFTMNEIRRRLSKIDVNIIYKAMHNLKERQEVEVDEKRPATYRLIK